MLTSFTSLKEQKAGRLLKMHLLLTGFFFLCLITANAQRVFPIAEPEPEEINKTRAIQMGVKDYYEYTYPVRAGEMKKDSIPHRRYLYSRSRQLLESENQGVLYKYTYNDSGKCIRYDRLIASCSQCHNPVWAIKDSSFWKYDQNNRLIAVDELDFLRKREIHNFSYKNLPKGYYLQFDPKTGPKSNRSLFDAKDSLTEKWEYTSSGFLKTHTRITYNESHQRIEKKFV